MAIETATAQYAHPRPMRADARRNYERLLAEARTAFTRHGTDASLEDIARRAGVGIGTLYRHFPNRTALMGAVFQGADMRPAGAVAGAGHGAAAVFRR
ncbi:hypothetical protein SANTM175S_07071 [Streptomyces antimycoticus]